MSAINFLELVDGAPFPMTKAELVSWCEDQGASEEALDVIQALPEAPIESLPMFNRVIGRVDMLPGGRMNLFSSNEKI
ncbi:MAG: hypothetical protein DI626_02780 [Micavibrio aeruginosavorus]|uniref:DUF2795 domain-containing protein n=1 Tax=Micavibrio aeruginosavorus TaxID=349221 RepID=A0A2W5A084_9BACT|nr:MAG: hypothetical protein DI626_02780 [Micavibrio aeruginosavorus]